MYKNDATTVIISRYGNVRLTRNVVRANDVVANHSLEEIAKRRGISMAQVSLAWLMSREGVTAPIIGPSSVGKLEDLLGTWCLRLRCYRITFSDPWRPCRKLRCQTHGRRSKIPGKTIRPYERCWTHLVRRIRHQLHMSRGERTVPRNGDERATHNYVSHVS